MDSNHIGMRPCENVLVLSEHFLDALSLPKCQEGTNIGEMIFLLRDLDSSQGICHQGIFICRVL